MRFIPQVLKGAGLLALVYGIAFIVFGSVAVFAAGVTWLYTGRVLFEKSQLSSAVFFCCDAAVLLFTSKLVGMVYENWDEIKHVLH